MLWLCIDTSGLSGSLAVARFDNQTLKHLHEVEWHKKAMHSEVATLQLQTLLTEAKLDLKSLTHILVNIGPGSFTGLRVGLSLAKTLAYALNLEMLGVNSLQNLAFAQTVPGEQAFVGLKAIQNFYYVGRYENTAEGLRELAPPEALQQEHLDLHLAGFTKVLIEGRANFSDPTKAQSLARFAAAHASHRQFSSWKSVEPLYVRASEAEEKLKKGLLKPL